MFEIELSLKIVSLPSQVVSVPFPTGGGWREGIFIQPHKLHKTQPAAQNKLLSTPRGSHQKEAGQLVSCPNRGGDLTVKMAKTKVALLLFKNVRSPPVSWGMVPHQSMQ